MLFDYKVQLDEMSTRFGRMEDFVLPDHTFEVAFANLGRTA